MITEKNILHEDNHLIIVNKPAGVLVQGDHTGDKPLSDHVKAYIKKKYDKPGEVYLGTVHRLDRPTSGCIIFAKTSKALTRMNQVFVDRSIKKRYWALTNKTGIPKKGRLVGYIKKQDKINVVKLYPKEISGSKKAELEYQVQRAIGNKQIIAVELKTGRKHQIRVQLRDLGCPIVGDLKYGYPVPNKDKSICLHCRSLEFEHPVSKMMISVKAALPRAKEWSRFL